MSNQSNGCCGGVVQSECLRSLPEGVSEDLRSDADGAFFLRPSLPKSSTDEPFLSFGDDSTASCLPFFPFPLPCSPSSACLRVEDR